MPSASSAPEAREPLPPPARAAPVRKAARWARRATFLIHRWLGIAIALLMAVWALSGLVMMYVAFPETTREERLAGLAPLDMRGCCGFDVAGLFGEAPVAGAALEMLGGRPVLRFADMEGAATLDLNAGAIPEIPPGEAVRIAREHLARSTGEAPDMQQFAVEAIERDQWTVYGYFRQYAPLYKVSVADRAGTVLYVAGTSGEIVQDTDAHERFWNWLGAVPHWLYFIALRDNQPLWYNIVVYGSVLGCFLTVTGIYIGVRQYGRSGRRSPYRGWKLWHHWTGLIFGLFTLTWVASGLFSMNPWGWFVSEGPGQEAQALAGRSPDGRDVTALIAALSRAEPGRIVTANLTIQDGRPYALLADRAGRSWRATLPDLADAPPSAGELAHKARIARSGVPIASQGLIHEADAYHYGHKGPVVLPAWRVIYDDDERTRLYFDPRTGEGIRKVDAAGRAFRWLHFGLHRFDFTGLLRTRPVWDIVTLPLMIGVSLLCVVGFVLGWRRLFRRRTVQSLSDAGD